jgi:signal transduction histidine kinase
VSVSVGELPALWGDPTLVKQVFVNLIDNAFKYTAMREQAVIEIGSREIAKSIDLYGTCAKIALTGGNRSQGMRSRIFDVTGKVRRTARHFGRTKPFLKTQ